LFLFYSRGTHWCFQVHRRHVYRNSHAPCTFHQPCGPNDLRL